MRVKKPDYQTEAAKELCSDSQVGERRGNPQLIPERAYRGAEAVTAKPSQKFLCPVRKHNHSQDDADKREYPISIRR